MEPGLTEVIVEPASWLVFFWPSSSRPWVDRLVPGRFKHVSAAGYIAATSTWLFVNPAGPRLMIEAIPDGMEVQRMEAWARGTTVLLMPGGAMRGLWVAPARTCVSVVASLLGIRSGALRPDGLYRDCLRAGARQVDDAGPEAGPVAGAAAASRESRKHSIDPAGARDANG